MKKCEITFCDLDDSNTKLLSANDNNSFNSSKEIFLSDNIRKLSKNEIVVAYIEKQINNHQLIIGNLKNNWEDESDQNYWKKIGLKIQINLIKFLAKNNVFASQNIKKFLTIFNHNQFYIEQTPKNNDWNQEKNTFKISWYYLYFDQKNEKICKLKTENFNEDDIVEYFRQKILSEEFLHFNVDNFYANNTEMWREQILEKIKIGQSFIIINNQKVEIENDLLDILWIDVCEIGNNEITFNLSYGLASTIIKIKTFYFLSDENINILMIKSILNIFVKSKILYFEKLHPFTVEEMEIDWQLLEFIKNNMKFRNLEITIFSNDFSLKLKDGTKMISVLEQFAEIDLCFKNLFVDKLLYFFPNYVKQIDPSLISDIINYHCLLNLSSIDLSLIDDDLQKDQIIQQIYQQIKDQEIEINHTIYQIGKVFKENNFKVVSVFLSSSYLKNENLYLVLEFYYDKKYFLQCAVKYQRIDDNKLEQKWNEVFQDAYIINKSSEKNIKCQDIFACRDIKDIWEAEVVVNTNFIFEKWKNIVGNRKVFLENFETIDYNDFEIQSATLHYFLIDEKDKNNELNLYSEKTKKYFHNNTKKFNGIMVNLKFKKELFISKPDWEKLNFKFIFPVLLDEEIKESTLTCELKNQ